MRFGRLALEAAPGELAGLADVVTVLLPWGSLLAAVAVPDPAGLDRLRRLCRPGAEVRVLFGYGPDADAAAVRALGLPALDDPSLPARLERGYRDAGLAVTARPVPVEEVRALPTTWAKKLAFSAKERRFVELRGAAAGGP